MKKFLVTTVCFALVYVITFSIVPKFFPGLAKLNNFNTIQIQDIENNNFEERIDTLYRITDNNNKQGNKYILDNQQQFENSLQNQDYSFNGNNSITEEVVSQATNSASSLTSVDINAIQLNDVKYQVNGENRTPVFVFTYNGQLYTGGIGFIGSSDVFVNEVNVEEGRVQLKQGQNTIDLNLDFSQQQQESIQSLSSNQ